MAIQCADVDTLVQTHLDGELAEDDARALKAHLAACQPCGDMAAEEARFQVELRRLLAPPPAPAHLGEIISRELERESWRERQNTRARWNWVLPAASTLAAAAALLFFVVTQRDDAADAPVAYEAVRQHMRRPPIEVQGTAVSPWIKRHLSPAAQVPQFSEPSISVRGARLSHLRGRDAVQVFYDVSVGHRRHEVSALLVDASDMELRGGRRRVIGGRALWVGESRGYTVVTHKDRNGIGYVFTSDMDADMLLDFVVSSNLLVPARERGW